MSDIKPDVRAEWHMVEGGVETHIYALSRAAERVFAGFGYARKGDYYLADFQMTPPHFLNAHHGFGEDLSVEIKDCRA